MRRRNFQRKDVALDDLRARLEALEAAEMARRMTPPNLLEFLPPVVPLGPGQPAPQVLPVPHSPYPLVITTTGTNIPPTYFGPGFGGH